MLAHFRIVLLAGGTDAFAMSLCLLILRIRACGRTVPSWTGEQYDPRTIREYAGRRRKQLFFEVLRLTFDFIAFRIVMLSGIYNSWFRLFPDSLGGFAFGFSFLITFTLIVSVAVDGLLLRLANRSGATERREEQNFFYREGLSILLVETGMAIVLVCIYGMERLHAGIPLTVIVSFLALMAFRALFLRLRNSKRNYQELPDSELRERLENLLEGNGYHVQRILVRIGGTDSATYGVRLQGVGKKTLVLDRSIIRLLNEEEICTAVMHRVQMEKQGIRMLIRMIRGLQIAVTVISLCIVLQLVDSSGREADAALKGTNDPIWLVSYVAGCYAAVMILQMTRNLGIRGMMLNADKAASEKDDGCSLRSALIRTTEPEMLNPDPVYEMVTDKPEFLPFRLNRKEQKNRYGKGA